MTQPFQISIADEILQDLRDRLARTRWPDEPDGGGWELGTDLTFLRDLCGHWQEGYDWRAVEAGLNSYPQFLTDIDGVTVHYVHVRGQGGDCLPLVLTHGWPSTFVELLAVVSALTDPAAHGGTRRMRSTSSSPPFPASASPTRTLVVAHAGYRTCGLT